MENDSEQPKVEIDMADNSLKLPRVARIPPNYPAKKNKPKKGDILETIQVPRVVSWRKESLWIRERSTKHGDIVEVRLLSVEKRTRRVIAKGYIIDKTKGKDDLRAALPEGFKCCFCNKGYKMTETFDLIEQAEEMPTILGFNILCGKCWGGKRSSD